MSSSACSGLREVAVSAAVPAVPDAAASGTSSPFAESGGREAPGALRRVSRSAGGSVAAGAGSPDGTNCPSAVGTRDITAVDVLDRVRGLAAEDDSFEDRLIGWLVARAPELVWTVIDDMLEFARTHGSEQ